MKNLGAKRFLSWLMSIVMVVGEFGGMPLAANAQEDAQVEEAVVEVAEDEAEDVPVVADDKAADQAVIVENSAATEVTEGTVADDEVVNEDVQNIAPPSQVNEIPVLADGIVSWNVALLDPDNSFVYDKDVDPDKYRRYERNGKTYISYTSYQFGISTSDNCILDPDETHPDEIIWIAGGFDIIDDNGNFYVNIPLERIIGEMYLWEERENDNIANGNYYVYVESGITHNISKASNNSFEFSALANATSGPAPVAKWTVHHDRVKKVDGEWKWWDGDYNNCPSDYLEKDNYKVVMPFAENVNTVAYKVRITGTVLDKGENVNEFWVFTNDGDVSGAASTYALVDDFGGIEVQAIRNDGTKSAWTVATIAAPWETDDRYVELNNAISGKDTATVSFEAPEFTKGINDTRIDDNRTPNDDTDDIVYVNEIGYSVYVDGGNEDPNYRWIRLGIENSTKRVGEVDTSYIEKNAVLVEMARMSIQDNFTLPNGVYKVYPTTGRDGTDYYYSDYFTVSFTAPAGNAVFSEKVKYRSDITMARTVVDQGGSHLDFWDNNHGGKEDAIEAGYDIELKHIELSVYDNDAIGYIVETPADAIVFGDGNRGNTICTPVYSNNGKAHFNFEVEPDFDYNDFTFTRVTATGKATANGANVIEAEHEYDGFATTIDDLAITNGVISWTPINGEIEREVIYVSNKDIDAIQNWRCDWLVREGENNKHVIFMNELVPAIVRDKLEGDETGGERGCPDFTPGEYKAVLVAKNGEGEYRSNEITIDLSKLGEVNSNAGKAEILYYTGYFDYARWAVSEETDEEENPVWEGWEYLAEYYEGDKDFYDLSDAERKAYCDTVNEGLADDKKFFNHLFGPTNMGRWVEEGQVAWDEDMEGWLSIEDYYKERSKTFTDEQIEYYGTIKDYWKLSDEQRDKFLEEIAMAEVPEGQDQFHEEPTMDAYLKSEDESAIGYVVKLPEWNNFVFGNDRSKFDFTGRGNDEDPRWNRETGKFGLLEQPMWDPVNSASVVAVYPDGSISAWNEGREIQWVDEARPDDETVVTIDQNAGIISWTQEYEKDENGNVVCDRFDEPVRIGDPGLQLVLDGGNGEWMAVYPPKYWDVENNKAYVNIGDVLVEMAYGKYHKVVDGEGENWVKGTYSVHILKDMGNDDRGHLNVISSRSVKISFDPATTAAPDLKAFWWDLGETYITIDTSNEYWKENVELEEGKDPTEDYNLVNKFRISFRTDNKNIGGYLIKINGHIQEPNFDEHNYASCYVGFEPDDDVSFEKGKDCDSTALLYLSLPANAADKYEIQAAAIYKNGTISRFVDVQKGAKEIKVSTLPTSKFYVGKDADLTGGKLAVTYPDSAEAVIVDMKDAEFSGYDKTKAGKQNIRFSYAGCVTTCEIEVLEVVPVSIEVSALPTTVEYEQGTDINPAGGKIKVTYNNGETKTIDMTADMLSGYDKNKIGEQTITVTYEKLTATFTVTVTNTEYVFDPTVQEEPVVGEGMKIFFDDPALTLGEDGKYHGFTYTGKVFKPIVRVTDNRVILTEGVNYKVTYKNNKEAGDASVVVSGLGTYSASETLVFVIEPRDISEAEIGGMVATSASKVKPVLAYGGMVLKKDKDYSFTVDENGGVEFTGLGNFTGKANDVVDVVTKQEFSKLSIKVAINKEELPELVYDGMPKNIDAALIVTDGTKEETTDYAVSYSDNVNAGTMKVVIVGTGNHKGKVVKKFKIKPCKSTDFDVAYTPLKPEYNKDGVKPFVVVSSNEVGELLVQGRDYTVSYKNNKKVGTTASFKLTFKGNYKGSSYKETNFEIVKPSLEKAKASTSGNFAVVGDMVFNKTGKYQPKAWVVIDGKLVTTKEYKLSYTAGSEKLTEAKDNLVVTAKATEKANYSNEVSISYNVVNGTGKTDVNKAKIKLTESGKSKAYGGAGDAVTLTPGTDFSITIGKSTTITSAEDIEKNFDIIYADNNAVTKKATIILKAKADSSYVGAFAGTFKINKAVIKKK